MGEQISLDSAWDLFTLLGNTRHAMVAARQKELAPYHITPRQALILLIIHDLGNKATLTEISKQVYREVHTISVQISRMAEKGLLKKKRETPGTTLTSFEITEMGLRTYDFVAKRESTLAIMSVLSGKERKQLRLYLDKLLSKSQELF